MRKRAGNLSGCNKKDIFAIASNAMAKMSFLYIRNRCVLRVGYVLCQWKKWRSSGNDSKKSINFVVEMVSHAGGSAEPGKGTGCDSPTVPAAVIPVRRCAQSSDKSHRIKVTAALASGRRDGPG